MDLPESDCPELAEKTADIIDDATLKELFVTTQMNNLSLCVKYGLKWVLHWNIDSKHWESRHVLGREKTMLEAAFLIVLSKFPHYWVYFKPHSIEHGKTEWKKDWQKSKLTLWKILIMILLGTWRMWVQWFTFIWWCSVLSRIINRMCVTLFAYENFWQILY